MIVVCVIRDVHQISRVQTMPWKASNRDQSPNIDISKRGWNADGSAMPSTAQGPSSPDG